MISKSESEGLDVYAALFLCARRGKFTFFFFFFDSMFVDLEVLLVFEELNY